MTQAKHSTQQPEYLVLGKIAKPHGVRGELRVRILTDYPERIAKIDTLYISTDPEATNPEARKNLGIRFNNDFGILKLDGISDRDSAELYRNHFIMVDIANAVPLDEGEFYLFQLIGLSVITTEDKHLGEIIEVLETGANDVYVVSSEQYGEILIPAHEETIQEIDLDEAIIRVRLPEGLLQDD